MIVLSFVACLVTFGGFEVSPYWSRLLDLCVITAWTDPKLILTFLS